MSFYISYSILTTLTNCIYITEISTASITYCIAMLLEMLILHHCFGYYHLRDVVAYISW